MEQLENSALARFEELLVSTQEEGSYPVLVTLLTSLKDYRELIECLTSSVSNSNFTNHLTDTCTQYALSHLSDAGKNYITDPKKQYMCNYLAGGTSNLITHWLQTGTKESPQQIAETIEQMNHLLISPHHFQSV